MQILYGFLAAVVMCIFAAVAIYFISAIRKLQQSIDLLIPELRRIPKQVDASAGQVISKMAESMNQVASLGPFMTSINAVMPEFLTLGKVISIRLASFHEIVSKFYKIAVDNSGGAIAPTNNQPEDTGSFFGGSSDEIMAQLERIEQARRAGFKQPSDPLAPSGG